MTADCNALQWSSLHYSARGFCIEQCADRSYHYMFHFQAISAPIVFACLPLPDLTYYAQEASWKHINHQNLNRNKYKISFVRHT